MPSPSATTFDVREIPFSYRGSWLNLSPVVGLHQSSDHVHLVSHQTGMHAVLRLEVSGQVATLAASPASLTWTTDEGATIEAAFESVDTIRVRGAGAALRLADAAEELTPFTGTYLFVDPVDGAAVFTSYETGRRYRVTALAGKILVEGAEALGTGSRAVTVSGDHWEVAIEEFDTARPPYSARSDFESVCSEAAAAFSTFVDAIAGWRSEHDPAAGLAAYVLWSATVAPSGFIGRESILMSKHWMDKVWSWDHCFNAIAVAPGDPTLAIDQLLAPFDHQDASGALPDSITHSEVLYNFVKPPIHGWALLRLREIIELDADALREVYDRLAQWTRFWLDYRRVPGHALPHYQHGNDSGWDNASVFDRDRTIESPDLAAFLLVQLGVLADLAAELEIAGTGWAHERIMLREALLAQLWDGEKFVAVGATSTAVASTTSLLTLLPIVAGEQLPRECNEAIAAALWAHLTEFGLATQRPDTPEYDSDGYWRGPIWAPSTVLIEDGLRRSGFTELADEVSARFIALCEASGFAENFNALSGEGLRDRAYTWTASAYLILARGAELRRASSANEKGKL